ncbi:MAG: PucR family transcriptional regulator [Lachnospiraceae bacterium]|jgi:hypothetical protein|nr:PucR family transcriptional regulator [Lachnospiraceae bacterium]
MVTVSTLLKQESLSELKVIAGHDGLDRVVKAISVMDAPDSYKWLRGNEIILTTGFLLGNDIWQIEHMVTSLIKAGSSALGIKKERFIHEIPESVILIAEANNFPIIEIPLHFRWSEIMSVCYEMISLEKASAINESITVKIDDQRDIYHAFMEKLLSGNLTEKDYMTLNQRRDPDSAMYWGIMLLYSNKAEALFNEICEIIDCPCFTNAGETKIYMIENPTKQETVVMIEVIPKVNTSIDAWYSMLFDGIEYCLQKNDRCCASIGRLYSKVEDIAHSYTDAETSLAIGKKLWQDKRCFSHPLTSIYEKMRVLPSLDLYYVRMLNNYQTNESYDVIDMLEAYVELGSYAKASSKFFLHENTFKSRISKLCNELNLNLSDYIVCNTLLLQIKCWRLQGSSFLN